MGKGNGNLGLNTKGAALLRDFDAYHNSGTGGMFSGLWTNTYGASLALAEREDDDIEKSYLEKALNQILLGNYTDDVNLLGTAGQIGLGLVGLDLPADIRDLVYDIKNWKWTWGHAGQTVLDATAFLPLVGSLKYTDEAATLIKGAAKHGDEVGDALKKGKNIDKALDAADGVKIPRDAVKRFSKGTSIPDEVLKTQPKHSPSVEKWLNNGGDITVGNGTWEYTNSQGTSVIYKNGYPDFKGSGHVKQEVDIGEFKDYNTDFKKANELTGGLKDPVNNMWHHLEEGKTLQEVNKRVHQQFTHRGGMSLK